MANKTKDLKYIIKEGETVSEMDLIKAYEKLMNEYFDRFGLSKQYLKYIRLKKKIALWYCEMWVNNKKHVVNFINSAQKELDSMIQTENTDPFKIVVLIEKKLGFQINLRKTSVTQFQNYLDLVKNG